MTISDFKSTNRNDFWPNLVQLNVNHLSKTLYRLEQQCRGCFLKGADNEHIVGTLENKFYRFLSDTNFKSLIGIWPLQFRLKIDIPGPKHRLMR